MESTFGLYTGLHFLQHLSSEIELIGTAGTSVLIFLRLFSGFRGLRTPVRSAIEKHALDFGTTIKR